MENIFSSENCDLVEASRYGLYQNIKNNNYSSWHIELLTKIEIESEIDILRLILNYRYAIKNMGVETNINHYSKDLTKSHFLCILYDKLLGKKIGDIDAGYLIVGLYLIYNKTKSSKLSRSSSEESEDLLREVSLIILDDSDLSSWYKQEKNSDDSFYNKLISQNNIEFDIPEGENINRRILFLMSSARYYWRHVKDLYLGKYQPILEDLQNMRILDSSFLPSYLEVESLTSLDIPLFNIMMSPPTIRAYILGWPLNISMPTDSVIKYSIRKLKQMGPIEYAKEIGKKYFLEHEGLIIEDSYTDYYFYDKEFVVKDDKLCVFLRNYSEEEKNILRQDKPQKIIDILNIFYNLLKSDGGDSQRNI